jgi:NADPH-dependent 2,4-dienoyl-CoA reductase/sulfur reductase-like enzyme
MSIERVVIAGGGLAGLRTAHELRSAGYPGAITMIGAEPHPPYDRPPLSKKVMLGEIDDSSLDGDAETLGMDMRLGEQATGLDVDAAGGLVRTTGGEYRYDRLAVVSGAGPVRLPGSGRQRVLRTIDDALAVRARLHPGTHLAIVGAGWIGAELATAAAARGATVTVVEAAQTPVAAALGMEAGAQMVSWYAEAGVDLRLGQPVESVEPGGLALPGGGWLAADEIVTAVGVRPLTGWLEGSGIEVANGVVVDERLRTSVDGVFSAGDCAAFWSGRYRMRLRVEHWDTALHAPEVVAANILGGDEVYDPVPYFWSEQFGRMVQYTGHHEPGDRLVWRGDPAGPRWGACWIAGSGGSPGPAGAGSLVAVLAVGRPRDVLQGRRIIASGVPVDAARLADPDIPIRDACAGT